MPLGKSVEKNIKELYADNKKKGEEKGAGGKPRSREQIIAIALEAAGKSKKGRSTSDGMMRNPGKMMHSEKEMKSEMEKKHSK